MCSDVPVGLVLVVDILAEPFVDLEHSAHFERSALYRRQQLIVSAGCDSGCGFGLVSAGGGDD